MRHIGLKNKEAKYKSSYNYSLVFGTSDNLCNGSRALIESFSHLVLILITQQSFLPTCAKEPYKNVTYDNIRLPKLQDYSDLQAISYCL